MTPADTEGWAPPAALPQQQTGREQTEQPREQVVTLIDDDDRVLALARIALARNGIRVAAASNAVEGLDLVLREDPDLVVLDIVMPDMSGWEVLRRVRAASDVPVLLLSGRDSDVDKARGLDLGADDYLTKPFSFLEFEARVRALLRRRRTTSDGDA